MSISNRVRFLVLRRDGFRCVYCGRSAADVELHVDHVHPKSKGGDNEITNSVSACATCNLGKGVMSATPEVGDGRPNVQPFTVAASPSLAGKCFVVFGDEAISVQGIVRSKIGSDSYLVQFMDWIGGEPSTMQIVPLIAMLSSPEKDREPGSWVFFEDEEHLSSWLKGYGKLYVD